MKTGMLVLCVTILLQGCGHSDQYNNAYKACMVTNGNKKVCECVGEFTEKIPENELKVLEDSLREGYMPDKIKQMATQCSK